MTHIHSRLKIKGQTVQKIDCKQAKRSLIFQKDRRRTDTRTDATDGFIFLANMVTYVIRPRKALGSSSSSSSSDGEWVSEWVNRPGSVGGKPDDDDDDVWAGDSWSGTVDWLCHRQDVHCEPPPPPLSAAVHSHPTRRLLVNQPFHQSVSLACQLAAAEYTEKWQRMMCVLTVHDPSHSR